MNGRVGGQKAFLFCMYLFLTAKSRNVALPVDLDGQVNFLSQKTHNSMVQRAAKDWRLSARSRPRKEMLGTPDYKNIIEKLQVPCSDCLTLYKGSGSKY